MIAYCYILGVKDIYCFGPTCYISRVFTQQLNLVKQQVKTKRRQMTCNCFKTRSTVGLFNCWSAGHLWPTGDFRPDYQ